MATFAHRHGLSLPLLLSLAAFTALPLRAQPNDPGVRHSTTDNGPPAPLAGLGQDELDYFDDGLARFQITEVVSGADATQGNGLGPRFNSNSCVSCHAQPAAGGSAPSSNPQIAFANSQNRLPSFITASGPVREVRFIKNPDGTPACMTCSRSRDAPTLHRDAISPSRTSRTALTSFTGFPHRRSGWD